MKHLSEYVFENLINEAAEGINMKVEKNLIDIITYLNMYQINIKCIIPDSDEIKNKYSKLEKWFCDYNDISSALFYLKTNGKLCMYEPNVKNIDDNVLKKYNITREGEKYLLPNINIRLEATSKKINSAKNYLKIWPSTWDKFIINGEYKINDQSKMPTSVIDFKNQGAYVLTDLNKIREDLQKSFSNIFGYDSILTNIFKEEDILQSLNVLSDKDNKKEIPKNMSNVLSEPLAIISLIDNIGGVQDTLKSNFDRPLGELTQIIIPISQNWPVADFYARFENLPDRLIAISVKSNGSGNTSTIIGCLPVANIDNIIITDTDKKSLLNFFNAIIPQFETKNNIELKISNEIKSSINNVSLYALLLLKNESCETKTSNVNKLVNTFKNLIDLIETLDKDLYDQLYKICELKGTNVIEKILVLLFNSNEQTINIIKNAVADATSCYKITVNNKTKNTAASVKCIKQSPDVNSFRLIAKQGGQGLKMIVKSGKLVDVEIGHKSSQGQWLGYTFR